MVKTAKKVSVAPRGITPAKAKGMLPATWHDESTLAIALASEHEGIVQGYIISMKKQGAFYKVRAVTGKIGKISHKTSREAHSRHHLPQIEAVKYIASLIHRKIHKISRKYVVADRWVNSGAETLSTMLTKLLAVEPCSVPYYKTIEATIEEIQPIDLPEIDLE